MADNIEPDHVQINISLKDPGAPRESFGLQAVLSHNAAGVFPDRSKPYGSYAEVLDDWGEKSPEARAMNRIFAQRPRPSSALMLSSSVPVTQRYEVGAATAIVGATYALDVKGDSFEDATVSYVAAALATQATINGQLLTLLNAVAAKNYTAAFATLPVVPGVVFTADPATDQLHIVNHGFRTGDGAERLTTTTTLPAGLALATDYFAIVDDVDHIRLATSLANAEAGTAVNITDAGTGVHTLTIQAGAHSPGSKLVVTANANAAWFALEPKLISRFDIAQTHLVTGMATSLQEILDEDDSWYALTVLYPSTDYIVDTGTWIETTGRTFVFDVVDSAVQSSTLVVGTSTDVGAQCLALAFTRTMGAFHGKPSEFESAAWMGRFLTGDPGKINPKFKTLALVTANKMTAAQKRNIRARRMNSYEVYGGASRTWEGTVFSTVNKFFDITRNVDWLHDELLVDLFDVIAADLHYDQEGVQSVGGAMHQAFDAAIKQGVSADDLDNSVTIPQFKDIPDEDVQDRVLQNIDGMITVAGFVNKVIANITVSF